MLIIQVPVLRTDWAAIANGDTFFKVQTFYNRGFSASVLTDNQCNGGRKVDSHFLVIVKGTYSSDVHRVDCAHFGFFAEGEKL